ncbi:MAG TPA: deoxyribonuclease IV, partial [Gaiellaceae bacterium]|nr:deoxyribonuclease IV [Gaiellaceae bacterium]
MQIGAHVSSSGGIHTSIDRAVAIGAESMQVFTQSPRTWRPTNHDPATFEQFRARRAETGMGGVLCHALYLCNLAAPDDAVYENSVAAMRNTMEVGGAIGADGVVFHVGSHLGAGFDAGLERVVPALNEILPHCVGDTWLLMENSAGTGGTIGRSLEELVALMNALDRHPRLGICLDSCHLY